MRGTQLGSASWLSPKQRSPQRGATGHVELIGEERSLPFALLLRLQKRFGQSRKLLPIASAPQF